MNPTLPDFAQQIRGNLQTLRKGNYLFRAGQRCSDVFVVQTGTIRLARAQLDGMSAVMQVAHAGQWLAESSLFAERYHCDAIAESDAVVWRMKKRDVLEKVRRDPERALRVAQQLASHLRELRTLHELLRVRRAPDRLLAWLRVRAGTSSRELTLDRTWSSVADELALSREALYRALARLKGSGRISVAGKRVRLRSP